MPMWIKQSLRLFRHELKRGELTIICFAIILAVATVFSLSGFSQQIKSALVNESNSFIASDRVLQSSRPANESILIKAQEQNLQSVQMLLFSSMAFAQDEMQLVNVKAVEQGYPLRGELLIESDNGPVALSAPSKGSIWVDKSLLTKLSVEIGDSVELGAANLKIAGVINKEPDASFSVFTQGPRVFLNFADIEQTKVVQPGSRLTYRYLFAGEKADVDSFDDWLTPQVEENQRWYDIKSQQSPLASALKRAESFLSLASMLGILLAAVAVSVASKRYGQRHQPMVTVFKAMGANKNYIRNLYLLHWSSLSAFSIIIGLCVGFIMQYYALQYMASYLPTSTQASYWYPLTVAITTGLLCACAFAYAPLKELVATPVLSVIRGFNGFTSIARWQSVVPAISAVFVLLLLFSKNIILSLVLLLSTAVIVAVLVLFGRVLISLGRKIGSGAGQSLHLAIANLKRRAKQNNVQLVSFTIAIMLLLLMLVVRTDLIDEWQAQLPENTPNQFLVNINQSQVPKVEEFLQANELSASQLFPIIRGRLTAINDEKLLKKASKEQDDNSDNGRQGLGRELNMTWQQELPAENVVIEGQWFSETDNTPAVSIESKLAERLNVAVGDELSFQIGSEKIRIPVTSIREVNWRSMQPNFYMIFSAGVLADFPVTYIASMHVPSVNKQDFQQFLSSYPTISVIDVEAMISQLRTVIEQVSIAIEFILLLVVIAGSLVLVAQVQASMEERERELAILRTLGAKGSLLRNSTLLEFVVLGAISGLLASVAMEVAVFFIQLNVFEMATSFHGFYWFVGISVGALFVGSVGFMSCWRLLKLSSLTLIRRTL
ncbi:ABC transporter permease [Thalassomonas sp. M1454]|uniref:ABC transporter permease n=1 Tax=Thalassomonas sp. M1454 TaxID=2594477 RepID=UPI00117E007E|nr:FtsX-like permease family protein [Thalassomonas sp. M1454]TRX56602.1 FtsX-like permease family protein [Thalassomonas sp. M1454]